MREFKCDCGETHAVVMDVHPRSGSSRTFWSIAPRAIETTSEEMPEFDTPHLLGVVLEEFPEAVVAYDASGGERRR